MEKIKKDYKFRIIVFLIAFIFIFEGTGYCIPEIVDNKACLRVPLDIKRPGSTINGIGITDLFRQYKEGKTLGSLISEIEKITKGQLDNPKALNRLVVLLDSACQDILKSNQRLTSNERNLLQTALELGLMITEALAMIKGKDVYDKNEAELTAVFAEGLLSDIDDRISFDSFLGRAVSEDEQRRYTAMGVTDIRQSHIQTPRFQGEMRLLRQNGMSIQIEIYLDNGPLLVINSKGVYMQEEKGRELRPLLPSRETAEASISWEEAQGKQVRVREDIDILPRKDERLPIEEDYLRFLFNVPSIVDTANMAWPDQMLPYHFYTEMRAGMGMSDEHIKVSNIQNPPLEQELRSKIINAFQAIVRTDIDSSESQAFRNIRNALMGILDNGTRIPSVNVFLDTSCDMRAARCLYCYNSNEFVVVFPSVLKARECNEEFLIGAMLYAFAIPGITMPWNIWSANPNIGNFELRHPETNNAYGKVSEQDLNNLQKYINQHRSVAETVQSPSFTTKITFNEEEFIVDLLDSGHLILPFGWDNIDRNAFASSLRRTLLKILKAKEKKLSFLQGVIYKAKYIKIDITGPNGMSKILFDERQKEIRIQLRSREQALETRSERQLLLLFMDENFIKLPLKDRTELFSCLDRIVVEEPAISLAVLTNQLKEVETLCARLFRLISPNETEIYSQLKDLGSDFDNISNLLRGSIAIEPPQCIQIQQNIIRLNEALQKLEHTYDSKAIREKRLRQNSDVVSNIRQIEKCLKQVGTLQDVLVEPNRVYFSKAVSEVQRGLASLKSEIETAAIEINDNTALQCFSGLARRATRLAEATANLYTDMYVMVSKQIDETSRQSWKDYYSIFGIGKEASLSEIKKTYRILARCYHPDINPGDKKAEEKFKEISEAYEILSNTEKRTRYDSDSGVRRAIHGKEMTEDDIAVIVSSIEKDHRRLVHGEKDIIKQRLGEIISNTTKAAIDDDIRKRIIDKITSVVDNLGNDSIVIHNSEIGIKSFTQFVPACVLKTGEISIIDGIFEESGELNTPECQREMLLHEIIALLFPEKSHIDHKARYASKDILPEKYSSELAGIQRAILGEDNPLKSRMRSYIDRKAKTQQLLQAVLGMIRNNPVQSGI